MLILRCDCIETYNAYEALKDASVKLLRDLSQEKDLRSRRASVGVSKEKTLSSYWDIWAQNEILLRHLLKLQRSIEIFVLKNTSESLNMLSISFMRNIWDKKFVIFIFCVDSQSSPFTNLLPTTKLLWWKPWQAARVIRNHTTALLWSRVWHVNKYLQPGRWYCNSLL